MVLLDHNWRCRDGEIDLILRDGRTLVICEVKTRRTTTYGTPFEAISLIKIGRLKRLAAQWLSTNGVRVQDIRLDMVGSAEHTSELPSLMRSSYAVFCLKK